MGSNTFPWFDRWHSGQTLKDLWPLLYNDCISPWIIVRQFSDKLNTPENLFHSTSSEELSLLLEAIPNCFGDPKDFYTWPLKKVEHSQSNPFTSFLFMEVLAVHFIHNSGK